MPAWLINLAWGALFTFISLLLAPKPRPTNAKADDVQVPRSEEGAEIGKVYGTVWIRNPQFADYGDFVKTPIVEVGPRRYGIIGPRSRTTIGFEYYFGANIVLCQTPIDGISNISFEDRAAWEGYAGSGTIAVHKPSLFGERRREGGVSGFIDIENGSATQTVNTYISTYLRPGELVSAHRGVFALVPKRMYWGNSAFIQALRIKAHNIFSTYGRWYAGTAPINGEFAFRNCAVHIVLDCSGSMVGDKFTAQNNAAKTFLDSMAGAAGLSIRVETIGGSGGTSIQAIEATQASIDAIKAFIDGLSATGNTDYTDGLNGAEAFFNAAAAALGESVSAVSALSAASGGDSIGVAPTAAIMRRVIVFMSDGAAASGTDTAAASIIAGLTGDVEVFCFAFEDSGFYLGSGGGGGSISLPDVTGSLELLDNTPGDGVPIIGLDDADQVSAAISTGFSQFIDINPAHILRDVITAPSSDGDGDVTVIGDSFATSAATLFNEGLGLSLFWQNPSEKDAFRNLVEQHISGKVYFDQVTGKWELKLIRNDYDVGTLHTFDSGNIMEWVEEFERPQQAELPNSITLVYTKRENGEPASVTVHNPAAIAATGRVINEKVELRGITWTPLANKIAQRELLSRTVPLAKGAIRVAYAPPTLNLASAFILNEPRVGADNVVCRVVEIEETDGQDNSIVVRFVEDVFNSDLTEDAFAGGDDGAVSVQIAQPSDVIFFEELSYFEQVQGRDQLGIDDLLTSDPGFGNWQITGNAPTPQHFEADIIRNDYPSWVAVGATALMPVWSLSSALSRAANVTTFQTAVTGRESELVIGQIVQIDSERMRLDSISISGAVATWTVGRGVLDTVPAQHAANSYVMAWPGVTGTDGEDYTDGDAIKVRLLPETSQETLALGSASDNDLTMASRAFRPLPVGQLQVAGSYAPAGIQSGTVTVTWVHRDRLDQVTEPLLDHTDAGIGPESGVSYYLVRRIIDYVSGAEVVGHTVEEAISPPQALTVDVDVDDAAFSAYAVSGQSIAMEIGIKTVRESSPQYENWQTPFVRFETAFAQALPSAVSSGASGSGAGVPGTPLRWFDFSDASTRTQFSSTSAGVTELANVASVIGGVSLSQSVEAECPFLIRVMNDRAAAHFDGTDAVLFSDSNDAALTTSPSRLTFAVAYELDNLSQTHGLIGGYDAAGGDNDRFVLSIAATTGAVQLSVVDDAGNSDSVVESSPYAAADFGAHVAIVTADFDSGSVNVWIDGVKVINAGSLTLGGSVSVNRLCLGASKSQNSEGSFLRGAIGEALVYGSILSDSDVALLNSYLAGRWVDAGHLVLSQVPAMWLDATYDNGAFTRIPLAGTSPEEVDAWQENPKSAFSGEWTENGGSQPYFEASGLNGLPAVRMASGRALVNTVNNTLIEGVDQDFTYSIAFSRPASGVFTALVGITAAQSASDKDAFRMLVTDTGNLRFLVFDQSNNLANVTVDIGGVLNDTSEHVVTITYDGTTVYIWVDGVEVASGGVTVNPSSFYAGFHHIAPGALLNQGSPTAFAFTYPITIGEAILVPAVLSSADISDLNTYLVNKWIPASV